MFVKLAERYRKMKEGGNNRDLELYAKYKLEQQQKQQQQQQD